MENILSLVPTGEHFEKAVFENKNSEGIWLTFNHLENIEKALSNRDMSVIEVQLAEERATNISFSNTVSEQKETIESQAKKIAEMETIIGKLQKESSGKGTALNTNEDEMHDKKVPSYLDANKPYNMLADKVTKK